MDFIKGPTKYFLIQGANILLILTIQFLFPFIWSFCIGKIIIHPVSFFQSGFTCPKCSFVVRNNQSNSQRSDYILGVAADNVQGIFPFIRTLRYTGCLASCVILTNQRARCALVPFGFLINACGIIIETIPAKALLLKKDNEICQYYWVQIKWWSFYYYIQLHLSQMNRVFLVDLFDIVFQGDPFTSEIKSDSLYCFCEYNYMTYDFSAGWARATHRPEDLPIDEILNHPGINGGMFLGGVNQMLLFCEHVSLRTIDSKHRIICQDMYADQGIINNLMYSGFCSKKNISCFIEPHASTKYGCVSDYLLGFIPNVHPNKTIGGLANPLGTFYLTLHLYDRSKPFVDSVNQACHPMSRNFIEKTRKRF